MGINIQNQLINILYSLILGLIFGAGYDIIRIVHILIGDFRLRHPVLFLLDFSYMLFLTAGCSVFFYTFNYGVYRLYLILPMVVGFVIYYNTVGRLVMLFAETLIRLIRTVLHYVLAVPFGFLFRCMKKCGVWLFRITVGGVRQSVCAIFGKLLEVKRKRYTEKQKKLIKYTVRF